MPRDTEVGSVTVGVVPDATGIEQKLKDQIVPAAERVGDEAGSEMSDAIEKKMTTGGDKSASRFEKSFKTRLKKALDNLPEAKIDGDVTNVERKIEEVRAEIKTLHDQPLIDKGEAARSIDQIMIRIAALRAEAAKGIDIPVDMDTQSALADFETAITKIRGKAITGALVPGGMFSRIPFSGSVTDKVLAAAQQKAAAAAAPSMADIFVEAQALQFARDQASITKRATSFAHIPLAMGEIIQDVTNIGNARAKMFAAGPKGIADVIQGVIREAMPASPYGEASFVAGVEGVQKAVFSMSKEIELFRKPIGDIVRYSDNMATNSEEFGRLLKEIAPSPTFGFGYRDLGGRRVWTGLSGDRAFRGMGVPEGLLHDPGLGGYLGGARFAAGADAIHDFSQQFSKDLVKFEKPMGEIVKYTANLNGTGQALIRMSDLIEQSDFSHLSKGDTFFKKMSDAISRGFRAGRQGVASRLRGIVSRRGTAAFPEDSGISEDVVSAIEARLRSGVPITGELTRFAQFLKSDAAKALGTPGTVTPGIIDAMEKRLTTGVPLTGELNRFARYIRLDAMKGVRRSLEDLIPMYGAGGGDVQKLLSEFGGGHRPADTATLLKAFGAGGGDLEKLLGMFGGGGAGGGKAAEAAGGGFFSSIADLIGPQGLAIGGGIAALSPFIGQLVAGAGVGIGGSVLAGLGIGGALHGLSNAATPAQIQAAQIQQAMATAQTAAAQDRLNKLMKSGKATSAELALAHMAVTAAQANQTQAGKDLANLMKNRITPEQQKMKDAFGSLSTNVSKSMTKIGQSFVPVLTDLANTTSHVVTVLTPVLTTAEGIISKALKPFLDAIVNSFGTPAVQKAILAIANAFAKILTAVTPEVGPAMTTIANSLADMANTVAKNPQAMANVFTYLMNIVNFLIRAADDLAKFANIIETWHGGIIGQTIASLVGFNGGITGPPAKGITSPSVGGFGLPTPPGVKFPGAGQPGAGPTFKLPGTPGKSYTSYAADWLKGAMAGIPGTFASISHAINIGGWFAKAVPEIGKFGKEFGKAMNMAWQGVDLAGKSARHNISAHFDEIRHDVSRWFDDARGWVATESVKMWNGMMDGLGIAWRDVHNFFTITVPANVKGWFKDAITWLEQAGKDVIQGLANGMKDWVNGKNEGQWIHDNVIQPLINIVTGKTFGFNIGSPAKKMVPIGRQIVEGIVQGMMSEGGKVGKFVAKVFGGWPGAIMNFISRGLDPSKLAGKAATMFQSIIGGVGTAAKAGAGFISKAWNFISGHGGASQWAGTVSKALTMLGLNQNLSGLVLRQMQSESGGDPRAINLTDKNARAGDPSRGLMQVIGSTFGKWHVAGTSWNIYDPLANIAAALNYAIHGRGIGTGKYQLGSGGPYDQGGWLPTGLTWAMNNTGKPERVLTAEQFAAIGSGHGPEYHAHFDGLTGQAIQAEVRTAFHMMSFTQGQLGRPGRRS